MLVTIVTQFRPTLFLAPAHVDSANIIGNKTIGAPTTKILTPTNVVNASTASAKTIQKQPAKTLTPAHMATANIIPAKSIEVIVAGGYTTWNPADKSSNITLSNSNRTATQSSSGDCAVRGAHVKTAGKWYFEITFPTIAGGNTGGGLAAASAVLGSIGGSVNDAAIQFRGGNIYVDGSLKTNNGNVSGATLGVAYDADHRKVWFRRNNGNWNADVLANQNPATNVGGYDLSTMDSGGLFPCWCGGASADQGTANFGATAFAFGAPSGFTGWTNV